jgi:hypothetical protein
MDVDNGASGCGLDTLVITRTYTVTDTCGNSSSCVQEIRVVDDVSPLITSCPSDTLVSCESEVPLADVSVIVATDNCSTIDSTNVSVSEVTNGASGCGLDTLVITRTYTVTDTCGNSSSCVQEIRVVDDISPLITFCPSDTLVSCESEVPLADVSVIVATDNCTTIDSTNITVSEVTNGASGCGLDTLVITRTYTVTDTCGNSSSCVQEINVVDDISPLITFCPPDTTLSCQSDSIPAADIESIVATDNCSSLDSLTITVTESDNGGAGCANDPFVLTRLYIVTDECGNSSTCAQEIRIVDELPPVILECPADTQIVCVSELPPIDSTGVRAIDNCTPADSIEYTIQIFDNGGEGCSSDTLIITRLYIAADECGNADTCAQLIRVADDIAPIITSCPQDTFVSCLTEVPAIDTTLIVATDNCTPPDSLSLNINELDNGGSGCAMDTLIINRTYIVGDACGNTATCVQQIRVVDDIAPVIVSCPTDTQLACIDDINNGGILEMEVTDNCTPEDSLSMTYSDTDNGGSGCTGDPLIITRTYTITDDCGNATSCEQQITVLDDELPFLIESPEDTLIACDAEVPYTPPVASDNCEDVIIEFEDNFVQDPQCPQAGRIDRIFTISDNCGNSLEVLQQIEIVDTVAPEIEVVDSLLSQIESGDTLTFECRGQDVTWMLPQFDTSDIIATDNCGETTVTIQDTILTLGQCEQTGYLAQIYCEFIVTDECENESTFAFYIEVVDTKPPIIYGVPADTIILCSEYSALDSLCEGDCDNPDMVYAIDSCECATIDYEEEILNDNDSCTGSFTLLRTWIATDNCGNSSSAQQIVEVVDDVGPELIVAIPGDTISSDTSLNIECVQSDYPDWVHALDTNQLLYYDICGSDIIDLTFSIDTSEGQNCELTGILGYIDLTWTATDDCGNSSSLVLRLNLVDTKAPLIIPQGDYLCYGQEIPEPEVRDSCGTAMLTYESTSVIDSCTGNEVDAIRWMAEDYCGNRSELIQPYIDTTAFGYTFTGFLEDLRPGDTLLLDCNIHNEGDEDLLEIENSCYQSSGMVEFDQGTIQLTDDCEEGLLGIEKWTWTYTDPCGNIEELSIYIGRVDTIAPVLINFEDSIKINCGDPLPNYRPEDECYGFVTLLEPQLELIEEDSCNSTHYRREIKVSDGCGNDSVYVQIVEVDVEGTDAFFTGLPEDGYVCAPFDPNVVRAIDPCFGLELDYEIERAIKEECGDGNRSLYIFRSQALCGSILEDSVWVIEDDGLGPNITFKHDSLDKYASQGYIELECGLQSIDQLGLDTGSVQFEDACKGPVEVSFAIKQDFVDCEENGYIRLLFYRWMATDICGNTSSFTFEVRIVDTRPPSFINFPEDQTVMCTVPEDIKGEPIAIDDCTPLQFIEVTYSEEFVMEEGQELLLRTWTATDACGNSHTRSQTLLIQDDEDFNCEIEVPETVFCNEDGVEINVEVFGGLGPYDYDWEITGGACEIVGGRDDGSIIINMGINYVELTVTVIDARGCTTTCTARIVCEFKKSIEGREGESRNYALHQNVPNPFNNRTSIGFNIPEPKEVTFTFFDGEGNVVHRIIDNYDAGYNQIELTKMKLSVPGVYYYEMKTDEFRGFKRMIMMD